MRNLIYSSLEDASRPYLTELLAEIPLAQHANVTQQVTMHRARLTDFCDVGYAATGMLSTDFIRGLHRAMFSEDYKLMTLNTQGEILWARPGEYKASSNVHNSKLHPGQRIIFLAPEHVPNEMERIVKTVNGALLASGTKQQKVNAILRFLIDFLAIHPFADANGRVACILADLLAIREGLSPFYFHKMKTKNQNTLYRALEMAHRTNDINRAQEMLTQYLDSMQHD